MSIPFAGFVGPSYQLTNEYAGVERTVNFFLEVNEAKREEQKFDFQLCPSPGNAAFSPLPVPAPFNQPNRGLLEYQGVAYGVNGTIVFKIDMGGNFYQIGPPIANDNNPVSMVANGSGQIGIASADLLYVIAVGSGTLTGPIVGGFLGASMLAFQDGYVLAAIPGTNQFQWSGNDTTPVGDMTLWDAANVVFLDGQADLLAAIISSREYVRLLGTRRSQVYIDSGTNPNQPFVSYNETFIETGIVAPFSLADSGSSLVWLGQDQRGQHTCWEDAQFQPRRISTFAVEDQWGKYPRIDDAIGFWYIWNGHLTYRITFPTADKTWEYDKTVSELTQRPIWTERNFTDWQGNQHARPELFHCFCYFKHLVGSSGSDGNPGAIYQMSEAPAAGVPRGNPQASLRWSNDAGQTWGAIHNLPLGQIGQTTQRVYMTRTGYARDRVFWLRESDPQNVDCAANGAGVQIQTQIVRDRICPHLWQGNKRVVYDRIEFEPARGGVAVYSGWVAATLDIREMGN